MRINCLFHICYTFSCITRTFLWWDCCWINALAANRYAILNKAVYPISDRTRVSFVSSSPNIVMTITYLNWYLKYSSLELLKVLFLRLSISRGIWIMFFEIRKLSYILQLIDLSIIQTRNFTSFQERFLCFLLKTVSTQTTHNKIAWVAFIYRQPSLYLHLTNLSSSLKPEKLCPTVATVLCILKSDIR